MMFFSLIFHSIIISFIRVFFRDTGNSQNSREREGTIFYSTVPLPPAHEHWDIYLQLCMWDDYNACVYQTATLRYLQPYWITICVIYWWCNVCLFNWWIDTRFLSQGFDIANRWIELTSNITLVLQPNRQNKCGRVTAASFVWTSATLTVFATMFISFISERV